MPSHIYLALGSNLGDREQYIRDALSLLEHDHSIVGVAPLYETEPLGYLPQSRFLNTVISAETLLSPPHELKAIQEIEEFLGRERDIPQGPRTIDLDLLLYDGLVIETEDVTIPHPRLHQRRFVLEPLAQLCPTLIHPKLGKTIPELYELVKNQPGVRLYQKDWLKKI